MKDSTTLALKPILAENVQFKETLFILKDGYFLKKDRWGYIFNHFGHYRYKVIGEIKRS